MIEQALNDLRLAVDGNQLRQLQLFEDKLYESNSVMNLTRVPREECWLRHIVDSLLFHDLVPLGARVLDIGTGPGFPAWPLAWARPDLRVVAIDSSGKMIGFLSKVPLANLTALQQRAEEWRGRAQFDVVTGRAVAPLGIQLELSAPFARIGGILLPMRTPADRDAIAKDASRLGIELKSIHERGLPGTEIVRLIPEYRKTSATPTRYPRTWAEIRRQPLI